MDSKILDIIGGYGILDARKTMLNNLKTFTINMEAANGQQFNGTFTCKRMSVGDRLKVGVARAQLSGGFYYDAENPGVGIPHDVDFYCNMMAHLQVLLVDVPVWYTPDFPHDDVCLAIFREVMAFQATFHTKPESRDLHSPNSSAGSVQADQAAHQHGGPQTVVAEQVQASLEP